MALNGVELALNTLGSKIYLTDVGVVPTTKEQLKGATKVGSPRSFSRGSASYVDLETGVEKEVPTNYKPEASTIGVANEYEDSIKMIQAWADTVNGDGLYKDMTVVLPAKEGWTEVLSYVQTVFLSNFKWNDIDGNTYQ